MAKKRTSNRALLFLPRCHRVAPRRRPSVPQWPQERAQSTHAPSSALPTHYSSRGVVTLAKPSYTASISPQNTGTGRKRAELEGSRTNTPLTIAPLRNREIPHHRRPPHLHGHDGLLQDVRAPAPASPAEHAQVRSSRYVFFVSKLFLCPREEGRKEERIWRKKADGGKGLVGGVRAWIRVGRKCQIWAAIGRRQRNVGIGVHVEKDRGGTEDPSINKKRKRPDGTLTAGVL